MYTNLHDAATKIANRETFKGNNLVGVERPNYAGWLSGDERRLFIEQVADMDYVVYSYGTPIAWHTPTGWYKVAQKFSVTTSRHQGRLYKI